MTDIEAVSKELQRITYSSHAKQGLLTLIVTLVLFVALGLFHTSVLSLTLLVLCLFIHELGHAAGMKIFGYRDVRMFFIPFLGAAVSSSGGTPSGARKAVVALLGPLPGIVIGAVLALLYFRSDNEVYLEGARIFLFINGFNLLPFYPLDGARVLEFVLFSRSPSIEVVFRGVTGLLLALFGFLIGAPVLVIIALAVLAGLSGAHRLACAAQSVKYELDPDPQLLPPRPVIERIVAELNKRMPSLTKPALLAESTRTVWLRLCNRPPSAAMSAVLLLIYFASAAAGIGAPLTFELAVYMKNYRSEIVRLPGTDGALTLYEVRYLGEQKLAEVPLNGDGYYHGEEKNWRAGSSTVEVVGTWQNGFRDGAWHWFNDDGSPYQTFVYTNGRVSACRRTVNGALRELEPAKCAELSSPAAERPLGPAILLETKTAEAQ